MSWILGVLIAVDQLGNAIAGGNPDATVSARTGYYASLTSFSGQSYWKLMEKIINFAFLPVDGPDHCYNCWRSEKHQRNLKGNDSLRAVLGVLIILVCLPVSLVTRIAVTVKPDWHHTQKRG